MIPDLRRKIGTLRLVSKYLDMKSRLKLANGIIISKMIYMINLWGSTRPTWLKRIQIVQNMAARYVTKENRYTRVSTLLNKCNWMSVSQMVAFHSMVLLWKTWNREGFSVMKNNLIRNNDGTFRVIRGRILLTSDSWKRRTVKMWNNMDQSLRLEDNAAVFKGNLKVWIMEHIGLRP